MSAGITSSVSGTTTTYIVTDGAGNTLTIAAAAPSAGGGTTYTSSGGLNPDGQILLQTLQTMLATGLRPNVMVNTVASFQN